MKKYFYILTLFLFSIQVSAQTDDNLAWLSIALKGKIAKNTSFKLMPTLRLNEDLSNYQNSSVDYAVKQNFGKGFSAQVLGRTWFLPNDVIRQFLWLDIGYAKAIQKLKISTSGRLHYAFDIDDRIDADFFRWKTGLTFTGWNKVQPFINVEPWWRLDNDQGLRRIRYEPGVKFKINKALDLLAMYRKEVSLNIDTPFRFNMYVVTLGYTLPKKKTIIIE